MLNIMFKNKKKNAYKRDFVPNVYLHKDALQRFQIQYLHRDKRKLENHEMVLSLTLLHKAEWKKVEIPA